jgi:hypothetical protein
MKKLLQKLTKEELIKFMLNYAEEDERFANAISVCFDKPDYKKELEKIKRLIGNALSDAADCEYRGGWGYLDVDVSDIVGEANQRAEQGHIKLAFMILEELYCGLLDIFEYQAECEIADEVERMLVDMQTIAYKAVTFEDREYIYNQCIALSDYDKGKDYGADYEDKLLKIAVKFVTKSNYAELSKVLSRLESSKWREGEFKLIRLDVIRKIEGTKAAEKFITENLHYEEIREVAFDKAMKSKNYTEAERLCIEALNHNNNKPHWQISQWLYKLHSVYEKIENADKMAETARKILLAGDLKYYDILKALLKKSGAWEKSYSKLLGDCKKLLIDNDYAKLLEKEKEYDLLLGAVKANPRLVYTYGKLLAKKYYADISTIFIEQINKEAAVTHNRKTYQDVCRSISIFAKAGYKNEVITLVGEYKETYKRRPAFVDELGKIKVSK